MKENLYDIKKNDVICMNINQGVEKHFFRVLRNHSRVINAYSIEEKRISTRNFYYNELKAREWEYVGRWRSIFKRLITLNCSKVEKKEKPVDNT